MTAQDQAAKLLADILGATRNADFAALDGLARRLESLLPELGNDAAALRPLRDAAARNIGALNAAAAGIKAAHRRLAEIRQIGRLTTYDQSGTRQDRSGASMATRRL